MTDVLSHLTLTIDDGIGLITVRGELDLSNADELLSLGKDAIAGGAGVVRINLSGVTFMDSTGLNALIGIRNATNAANRLLILNRPSDRVRRVIDLAGLTKVFNLNP